MATHPVTGTWVSVLANRQPGSQRGSNDGHCQPSESNHQRLERRIRLNGCNLNQKAAPYVPFAARTPQGGYDGWFRCTRDHIRQWPGAVVIGAKRADSLKSCNDLSSERPQHIWWMEGFAQY